MTSCRFVSIAIFVLFAVPASNGQAQTQNAGSHPPALTMSGDIALWTVAIKPNKTADFERVLAKLHSALEHSADPKRQQQAAGW